MSSRRIEFTYYPIPHVGGGPVWSPIIPIRISCKNRETPYFVKALIDSGADVNLFPAEHAEALGISVKSGLLVKTGGVGGIVRAYRHNISIQVGNKIFKTTTDFTYEFRIALLGRKGFFDLFKKVSFSEKKRMIVLDL